MGGEALLSSKLDTLSTQPLYRQLALKIKALIKSGELECGSLLPSELELCEKLKISRSTVRQSFAQLESEGYIVRHRGKGTYVSIPKVKRSLSRLCSFTKQMDELGISSVSKIIEFTIMDSEDAYGLYGVSGRVYKIVRLRETDGQPFMIDTAYIPVGIAPALKMDDLSGRSMYDVIEEMTGNAPQRASESYEVVKLGKNEAKLLKTEGRAAFMVKRTSRLATGEIYEMATMLIRGDRCRLEARLEADAVAFSRTPQY